MDIPFPPSVSSPDDDFSYTILFDNGTSASVPLREMSNLIPPPPITSSPADDETSLLPPFLQLNSKITYEHDGQFHKGYLGQKDGVYRFSFKSHVNKRKEDWGVPLPNLPSTWVNLCVEGILIPGHVAHSFLRSSSTPGATTFDPVASFVSAVNLHRDCPPSLLKALAASHPDREVWLESFYEEKRGIEDLDTYTYTKILLAEYRNLRENGAPHAIPTMCVLTIKKRTRISVHSVQNRVSWYLAIMRSGSGRKARNLPPSFVRTLFGSLPAWPSPLVVLSVRAIARTPFVKESFLPTRLLSFVLLAVIQMRRLLTNIGSLSVCFTVSVRVPATGLIRSAPFYAPLVFVHRWRTRASIHGLYR
jgi:hypothetical protein